jgi:putative hydrolase of the HAD superfamily
MARTKAIFFDVGGVLLTDGWDVASRRSAVARFGLNGEEFEKAHELAVAGFETGRIGLDEYLDRTVFGQARPFTRDEFKAFVWAQSQPQAESLAIVAELARSRNYLLATLNNESRDLNEYRIERFGLRELFTLFLASGFLGVRKPDERIFRLALEITQRSPEECLFIDDRTANVEAARRVGIPAIQYRDAAHLREDLRRRGICELTE